MSEGAIVLRLCRSLLFLPQKWKHKGAAPTHVREKEEGLPVTKDVQNVRPYWMENGAKVDIQKYIEVNLLKSLQFTHPSVVF